MNQDKMYLINKLFNNKTIRTIWVQNEEKYYVSVVDVVGALTESKRPRKYWSDLKDKLKEEGSEVSDKIGQLKLKASDGKYRLTNVVDIEKKLGESVVTNENRLNYQYKNESKIEN